MGSSCFSIVSLMSSFLRYSVKVAGLTSQTAEIDGDTTIHFWGPPTATAKPKLVLIHGFGPASIWQWRPQISFFAAEFDVYAPDLLFFGDSFTNSPDRSEVFQANCMAKLLEKLGIRRYSLVGISYGGYVAYHMAATWPDRVDKVVITSSAVNNRPGDFDEMLKRAKVEKIEDLFLPVTTKQLRLLLDFVSFRRPYMPDFLLKDSIDKLFSENRKEKMELLHGLVIGRDETFKLSSLPQEVLIVWGEHDQIFLLEKATELQKLLGEKAKLEVIKNSSHAPPSEQPGQFNKIVKNFLHGLP